MPGLQSAQAVGETRTLTLHHIHTGEDITITFKRNGQYDDAALKKLDQFVRDWRKDEGVKMDPKLYDMMWEVVQELGYKSPVHIICGYRSPATNSMLRSRSSGVARTSLHMAGKAMDFSLPGADVAAVRAAALRVQGGGVGYYPSSGVAFVHMDVGNVRHWPRMTREQLAKVFPDGRTLHIPTDGQPMPGYALALADAERGVSLDRLTGGSKQRNLLASLFGGAQDQEEIADQTSLPQPQRATAPAPRRIASIAPEPAAEQLKPVPLPPRRPTFEVASHESRPVTLPPRGVNVAALSPNQIIGLRGYWQGPQETTPAVTASIDGIKDRIPPEIALAYASRGEPQMISAPAMITRQDATLIATKHAEPTPMARTAATTERLDNPWLRGVLLAPRLETAMTVTTFGPPDFSNLKPFMQKPASSVLMTFSADPHLGMTVDHFTGSAVVFQATVTFGMRTAQLQQ